MGRVRFDEANCGIARSLDMLGDWWTLLIIRDAFLGASRFSDFQQHLGIARNVLTQRLRNLVDHEILERVNVGQTGDRYEYRLTVKGEALLPVLTTLREWGDEWVFGEGQEPLLMVDRETGERVPKTVVRNAEGRALGRRDLKPRLGPGFDQGDKTRVPGDAVARPPRPSRAGAAGRGKQSAAGAAEKPETEKGKTK
ncbi:MAG: winged helix-turn-helix transcriptional regulator [Myxococcota bacterium]